MEKPLEHSDEPTAPKTIDNISDSENPTDEELAYAFMCIGRAFDKVGQYLGQAIMESTTTLEEPRLTDYMKEHLDDNSFPSADLIAILKTIDPSIPEQVLVRAKEIQKYASSAEIRRLKSPRLLARLLFQGTRAIRLG